ncbi:hypothetical protein FEM48_Zijuj09G0157000 [Ziziphus jujuba var. spinosa]|uniref:Uncharacterized protein n=1 Tax=Ziziphus jujuba var. spinosa TaxID=714518 RepID=A0A978UTV2_ZIZJJ|nr:hypothetical protein FEM48_Zijuj09G0157000 [Ziziphus jujuba var. spinosa]
MIVLIGCLCYHSTNEHEKCVDQILDASLLLLEFCSTAKNPHKNFNQPSAKNLVVKLSCQDQSTIRKKLGGKTELSSEIRKFLTWRKVVKAIGELNCIERCTSSPFNKDNKSVAILREVQTTTLAVSESLWSFISGPKSHSKPNGWSLISNTIRAN